MNDYTKLLTDLQEIAQTLVDEATVLQHKHTKAGARRVRKLTTDLGHIGKDFRKSSVEYDKSV